jgi:hypothetical protein
MRKKILCLMLILFFAASCGKRNTDEIFSDNFTEEPLAFNEPIISERNVSDEIFFLLSDEFGTIDEFIPDEWEILDYVKFDYNDDGFTDIVGILQHTDYDDWEHPRILFAAKGTASGFSLDFAETNLIRTRFEGGIFGDPFMPLSAEGNTFTIEAYGGSAWKWHEQTTFEYRNGWYLARERHADINGTVEYSIEINDYTTRIGTRKLNSSNPANIIFLHELDEPRYELEYIVTLDDAPTLREASARSWLAKFRNLEIPIREIFISEGVDLDPSDIPPSEKFWIQYADEFFIIFVFHVDFHDHLAVYNRESQTINVFLQSSAPEGFTFSPFSDATMYRDKIYFIERNYYYLVQIVRMNTDGSEREIIFSRDNDVDVECLSEIHLYIRFYLSGGELIATIESGYDPIRLYRMRADGTNVRLMGELRGFVSQGETTPFEHLDDFSQRKSFFDDYAGVTVANEDFLNAFEYVHELDEYVFDGEDVVVWATNKPLNGLEFLRVSGKTCDIIEDYYYVPGEVVLALDVLPQGHAVVLRNHVGNCLHPAWAISFLDSDGKRRYAGFVGDLSAEIAPFLFVEFMLDEGKPPIASPPWSFLEEEN